MIHNINKLVDYFSDERIDQFKKIYVKNFAFDMGRIIRHIKRLGISRPGHEQTEFIKQLKGDIDFSETFSSNTERILRLNLNKLTVKALQKRPNLPHDVYVKYNDYDYDELSRHAEKINAERMGLHKRLQELVKNEELQRLKQNNGHYEQYLQALNDISISPKPAEISSRDLETILNSTNALVSRLKQEKLLDATIAKILIDIEKRALNLEEITRDLLQEHIDKITRDEIAEKERERTTAKNCITAYELYMAKRIKGADRVHVMSYIDRLSRHFLKNRGDEKRSIFNLGIFRLIKNLFTKRPGDNRKGPRDDSGNFYKDSQLNLGTKWRRLVFFKLAFYCFLFALDGAFWGKLVLSPVFEKIPALEALSNVTLIDFLFSRSSSWQDLWAVAIFHLISFFVVLLLSRIPTRLAFYNKMRAFVKSEECKDLFKSKSPDRDVAKMTDESQVFSFRGTAGMIEALSKKLVSRRPLYYLLVFAYYLTLSFLPAALNMSAFVWMLPLNLLFWLILHFSYRWIGEISFILKEELRRHIENYVLIMPAEIDRIKQGSRQKITSFIQQEVKKLNERIYELGQRLTGLKQETTHKLKPVLELEAQDSRLKQELQAIQTLLLDLKNITPAYDERIKEIGMKINVIDDIGKICTINYKAIKEAIEYDANILQ